MPADAQRQLHQSHGGGRKRRLGRQPQTLAQGPGATGQLPEGHAAVTHGDDNAQVRAWGGGTPGVGGVVVFEAEVQDDSGLNQVVAELQEGGPTWEKSTERRRRQAVTQAAELQWMSFNLRGTRL